MHGQKLIPSVQRRASAEEKNKEAESNIQEIKQEIGERSALERAEVFLALFTLHYYARVAFNLFFIFFILLPENYEFFHFIRSKIRGGEKDPRRKAKTPFHRAFSFCVSIIEGLVSVIHTVFFAFEIFLDIEVPYSLLFAIVASHCSCFFVLLHLELFDRERKQRQYFKVLGVEILVVVLSVLLTVCYAEAGCRFNTIIMMAVVMTHFLCRSLTKIVHESRHKVWKTLGKLEYRLQIVFGVLVSATLLELSYIYYFSEK